MSNKSVIPECFNRGSIDSRLRHAGMTGVLYVFSAILIFLTCGLPTILAQSVVAPPHSLPEIIRKIENRRGGWIAMKAELSLHFLTSDHNTASCRAELVYQRLEEKILLKGFNAKNDLLFIFKTADRRFELFLPDRKTIYRGNIFELEDSPEIESHLKPLDLYRALKPMAIPLKNASVENWDGETVLLKINGERDGRPYLARRLVATEEGETQVETYYSFEEKPVLTIRRAEFKRVRSYFFPHRIKIEDLGVQEPGLERKPNETVFLFEKIDFMASVPDGEWYFPVEKGTEVSALPSATTAAPHSS